MQGISTFTCTYTCPNGQLQVLKQGRNLDEQNARNPSLTCEQPSTFAIFLNQRFNHNSQAFQSVNPTSGGDKHMPMTVVKDERDQASVRPGRISGKAFVVVMVVVLTLAVGGTAYWNTLHKGRNRENVRFTEQSQQMGIHFVHQKPSFDPRVSNIMPWLVSVGASASAADYNRSGRVSVFFTNSRVGYENALYRNDGLKNGVSQFTDVTDEVGLKQLNTTSVSMAAAWGDYDNDGYPDLYVMRVGGGDILLHNVAVLDSQGQPVLDKNGVPKRKFVDVTKQSGTGNVGYGVGALWFDYDRDGRLDLVVADYFPSYYPRRILNDPSLPGGLVPLDLNHLRDTRIMPDSFNNARNGGGLLVYHNDGNGHFSEVHEKLGMIHTGFALALGAGDLNNDGWPDLYVANDFGPDDYYVNMPGSDASRKFVRVEGGFTADKVGRDTKKGMNVDVGDVDHSGNLSIYVTNITNKRVLPEGNLLWMGYSDPSKPGGWNFEDRADSLGVNDCGWSWGAKFADVNNDGWNDLFVANGFISASKNSDYWYELENMASDYRTILEDALQWPTIGNKSLSGYQRSCLFVRDGKGFSDLAQDAGITDTLDGRGVATADLSNSGSIDFVVSNQGGQALVYQNKLYSTCKPGMCPHWIGFSLGGNGTTANKDAIGARLQIVSDVGTQTAEVSRGNGFASQSDPRLHFGLGRSTQISKIIIRWPDGHEQAVTSWKLDTYNEIDEAP